MNESVQDDTHSDYHAIKDEALKSMRRGVWTDRFEPRWVPFASRRMRCDLPREAIEYISEGKHYISYRGIPMAKDPLDLTLYDMLFYEIKPASIIELGTYTGASTLWMADRLKSFGHSSRIIGVDIDSSLVHDVVMNRGDIEFIEGDCNQVEDLFTPAFLEDLPHPLVLIDDAHVNIEGVYGHFHEHAFREGDYLIIEDTIPWIPGTFGEAEGDKEWGDWKWQEVRNFFAKYEDEYRVDRYYTDFFGYNGTWNWNGFVKRI